MARNIFIIYPEQLEALKRHVIRTFGKNVSTLKDCEELVAAIWQKVTIKLSVDTIRRVFSIIESAHQPSTFTLNSLAQYAGFIDWQHLNSQLHTFQIHRYRRLILLAQQPTNNTELLQIINHEQLSDEFYDFLIELITIKFLRKDIEFIQNLKKIDALNEENGNSFTYSLYYLIQTVYLLIEEHEEFHAQFIEQFKEKGQKWKLMVEWIHPRKSKFYQRLFRTYNDIIIHPDAVLFSQLIRLTTELQKNGVSDSINMELKELSKQKTTNNILHARLVGLRYFSLNNSHSLTETFEQLHDEDEGNLITNLLIFSEYAFITKAFDSFVPLYSKIESIDQHLLSHWGYSNKNNCYFLLEHCFLLASNNKMAQQCRDQYDLIFVDQFYIDLFN